MYRVKSSLGWIITLGRANHHHPKCLCLGPHGAGRVRPDLRLSHPSLFSDHGGHFLQPQSRLLADRVRYPITAISVLIPLDRRADEEFLQPRSRLLINYMRRSVILPLPLLPRSLSTPPFWMRRSVSIPLRRSVSIQSCLIRRSVSFIVLSRCSVSLSAPYSTALRELFHAPISCEVLPELLPHLVRSRILYAPWRFGAKIFVSLVDCLLLLRRPMGEPPPHLLRCPVSPPPFLPTR